MERMDVSLLEDWGCNWSVQRTSAGLRSNEIFLESSSACSICTRECGMALELDDVPVHSLVPEPLRSCATADEYLARLPEHDGDMAEQLAEASLAGECLRYVGVHISANVCSSSM